VGRLSSHSLSAPAAAHRHAAALHAALAFARQAYGVAGAGDNFRVLSGAGPSEIVEKLR